MIILFDICQTIATIPFIPGHEAVGIVTCLGAGCHQLRIGDRVAVENHFYCGEECFKTLFNLIF